MNTPYKRHKTLLSIAWYGSRAVFSSSSTRTWPAPTRWPPVARTITKRKSLKGTQSHPFVLQGESFKQRLVYGSGSLVCCVPFIVFRFPPKRTSLTILLVFSGFNYLVKYCVQSLGRRTPVGPLPSRLHRGRSAPRPDLRHKLSEIKLLISRP